MAKRVKPVKVTRPKSIKVHVTCVAPAEKEIEEVFFQILDDYVRRFSQTLTDKKWVINICLVEYPEESNSAGLTVTHEESGRIMIQLRDPALSGWEGNPYTMDRFVGILCHEIVHACQDITGRMGFRVTGAIIDKKNEQEMYFFDPVEVEARALESFYTTKFCGPLIEDSDPSPNFDTKQREHYG